MADYTFAVAKIRELENELLDSDDMKLLVEAKSKEEFLIQLASKISDFKDKSDITEETISNELLTVWDTVSSLALDSIEIQSLTVINDFYNLKTALKAHKTGENPDLLYAFPTAIDVTKIFDTVENEAYFKLPKYLIFCAEKGEEILMRTGDAQQLDIFADAEAMKTLNAMKSKSKSELFRQYTEFFLTETNIKIAYRSAMSGKNREFIRAGLCDTDSLDSDILSEKASNGIDEFMEYIKNEGYYIEEEKLRASIGEYEKFVDDSLISLLKNAKYESFCVDPIFAYYQAKRTELKNIAICLACKSYGMPEKAIIERLREVYV